MKMRWIGAMLVLCLLLPLGAAAEQNSMGEQDDAVYKLMDEQGKKIASHAGRMYPEDEYISGDDMLYRIISVDDEAHTATARLMGKEPAVDAAQLAMAFSQLGEKETMPKSEKKLVAMYATHSDESYEPTDGTHSKLKNAGIYDVCEEFKENLEELGIEVKLDTTTHLPHDSGAYRRSRQTAVELLKSAPAAIFDIHRDGIPDPDEYEKEIDGEEASRVRLLVGRSNPDADANREFAKQIKKVADEKYPGLIKDIFIGKGNYNQELYPKSVLLEFGTHTIEKDRAMQSTEYMANVIDEVLFGGVASAEGAVSGGSDQSAQAQNEQNEAGANGIFWFLGIALLGGAIYALAATGSFKKIGEKFSRGASEMSGGLVGKKPEDKEKK
jgi:stage II sporulation protein P